MNDRTQGLYPESAPSHEGVVVPRTATDATQLAGAEAIRIDTTPIYKLWTARKGRDAMLAAAPAATKEGK